MDHPLSPFKSIALTFSGGGFRAAAFSLGVLSYLNKVKLKNAEGESSLLSHVNFIASTSGGTITNLMYSSYLFKSNDASEAFRLCFNKLYREMKGEALLEKATEILANSNKWNEKEVSKQRNVINAFSRIYDEALFNGETFDVFWRGPLQRDFSVCFNSTEFTRGISFRFQHESDKGLFKLKGNRYIHFKPSHTKVLAKLKLGDILAASSCFPSGFEPIIFPEDFAYTNQSTKEVLTVEELKDSLALEDYYLKEATITDSVALMDGGVTDNQALYSVMHADDRRRNDGIRPFDLIMINDVTSYFMEPYKVDPPVATNPEEKNILHYLNKVNKMFKWFKWIKIGLIAVLLFSVAGIFFLKNTGLTNLFYFLSGFSALGVIIMSGLQYIINLNPNLKVFLSKKRDAAIRNLIMQKSQGNFSESVISNLLTFLKEAKLSNLRQLIMSRAKSVITMTVEVNLKQVRRLIYSIFYENDQWENRRASNFIYEFGTRNEASRKDKFANAKKPDPTFYLTEADRKMLLDLKPGLTTIADAASKMGTTLWFAKGDVASEMLDTIIQCGQFSTCANLLEYTLTLIRQAEAGVINFSAEDIQLLEALKEYLLADWNAFNDRPDFYFNQEMKSVSND